MSEHLRIIPREEWGARYREGFGARKVGRLEKWLHHTVTYHLPVGASFADEARQMRIIEHIGQERFGGGISYPFLVFPSGRIYEGLGIERIGAHTSGHNTVGVAICLPGNYMTRGMTPEQEHSVVWLLQHGVTRGWWRDPALTGGHRDVKVDRYGRALTSCPGDAAYGRIPDLNRAGRGVAVSGIRGGFTADDDTEENTMALSANDRAVLDGIAQDSTKIKAALGRMEAGKIVQDVEAIKQAVGRLDRHRAVEAGELEGTP